MTVTAIQIGLDPDVIDYSSGPAVLVRPDGYIAWAGDSANCSEWLDALAQWAAPAARPHVVSATA